MLLSVTKLVGRLVNEMADSAGCQSFLNPLFNVPVNNPKALQRKCHFFANGVFKDLFLRILKQTTEPATQTVGVGSAAEDLYLSLLRTEKTCQTAQQSGFAGPIQTGNGITPALLNVKGDL